MCARMLGVVVSTTILVTACVSSEPERLLPDAGIETLTVGESVEATVSIRDSWDTPVPDHPVRLTIDTSGTVLSADVLMTGLAGLATVMLTASNRAGLNRLHAVAAVMTAIPTVSGYPPCLSPLTGRSSRWLR